MFNINHQALRDLNLHLNYKTVSIICFGLLTSVLWDNACLLWH